MTNDSVITALTPQRRRNGKRVNVYVDGAFAFSVDVRVAETLSVGQSLAGTQTARVLEQDQFQVALDTALAFLGHRPRSEREIRQRLARAETPPSTTEAVVTRLREWDLVDDSAFAQYWVEQRQTFRPRGARLLQAELRQRGVDAETVQAAVAEMDETAEGDAYRAGQKKARLLAGLDQRTFQQRLGQFLARRGFDWDTIAPTVERLWEEVASR